MGFLDKVKEQAEKAKTQAQDLKGKVGDKVDEVQDKRKADGLLADLGRLVYAEQTGRPTPGADAESQRLVAELKAVEAQGTTILASAPSAAPPVPAPQASAAAPPAPPPPPPPPLPTP